MAQIVAMLEVEGSFSRNVINPHALSPTASLDSHTVDASYLPKP